VLKIVSFVYLPFTSPVVEVGILWNKIFLKTTERSPARALTAVQTHE